MKKITCFLFFLCSLNSAMLCAQQETTEKMVSFGLRAAVNLSNINFSKGYGQTDAPKTEWKAGANFGAFLQIRIVENFYVQPEYLYSEMSSRTKVTNIDYNLKYLSLPLMFKYRLLERLELLAGPQFDILLKATQEENGQEQNITHDTEERSFNAAGGISYKILPCFSVGTRFIYGLNHIGFNQREEIEEFKLENFQFTLSFIF